MKIGVRDAIGWTPERGVLSAEDGLGSMSRFSRTCAALSETIWTPNVDVPVVLGTTNSGDIDPSEALAEVEARWASRCALVRAGLQTVPLSLLEARFAMAEQGTALWVVVDLTPGAEVAAAFLLSGDGGDTLELAATEAAARKPPPLNPCAGVLQLADVEMGETVSIQVGSWTVARYPG